MRIDTDNLLSFDGTNGVFSLTISLHCKLYSSISFLMAVLRFNPLMKFHYYSYLEIISTDFLITLDFYFDDISNSQ